jgi:hypothetical protein
MLCRQEKPGVLPEREASEKQIQKERHGQRWRESKKTESWDMAKGGG